MTTPETPDLTAPAAPKRARPAASKPAAKPAAAQKAGADVAASKPLKVKLVRDSFTMPELEYTQLEALKRRALGLAHHAKKSELLRAGVAALAAMDDATLLAALQAVPPLKTGRPKAQADAPVEAVEVKPKAGKAKAPKADAVKAPSGAKAVRFKPGKLPRSAAADGPMAEAKPAKVVKVVKVAKAAKASKPKVAAPRSAPIADATSPKAKGRRKAV
jgi:hypothetical protein